MGTKKKAVATLRPTGAARLLNRAARARARTTAPAVTAPTAVQPSRRGEQLVRDVTRLRADITANFYQMGLALRELSQRDTYRSLGHASFAELLEARDLVSRITAFRLITIVDSLPEPLARPLGVEKSYAVIRYAQLAHPDRDVAEIVATDPAIRLGARERLPLSAISAETLLAATRALRTGHRPAAAGTRAKRAARSLAQHLDHAGIDADRVRSVRRGASWRIRIDLAPEEAEELAAFLASSKRR